MGLKWLWVVVLLSVLSLEVGWSNGCWEQERLALLQLKPFFPDLRRINWTEEEGSDCCQWERVECNKTTRRVTKLSLTSTIFNFQSIEKWYLNASLFLPFEELRTLYLNRSQIAGCVESEGFGKLSELNRLEILDLRGNYFNGSSLSTLTEISSPKSLYLAGNLLDRGSNYAQEFYALSNLETLDLSWNEVNQFVISKEKRCLRKLKILKLDGVSTKQSFSLVSLLEPFSSVKTISLTDNSYLNKTVITQELHMLRNVKDLFLDNTRLGINFLQSIGSLTSLKTLSLSNCGLIGTLPAEGWCYLKSLEELRLNGNALHDDIASCLDIGDIVGASFPGVLDDMGFARKYQLDYAEEEI
ncbi:hypothetical protein PTKIN_Ptkin09bG0273000 [Pterospermum kingtungense]